MAITRLMFVLMSACLVSGQRPSFAGSKPIGFPILTDKPSSDSLGNRFGSGEDMLPLPIEANGDRDLIERISKMPVDQQPFWYINWKALEENRKKPQTYQPSSNSFLPQTGNTATSNSNTGTGSNIGTFNRNTANSNSGLTSKFGTSNNARPYNDKKQQNYKYKDSYRSYY